MPTNTQDNGTMTIYERRERKGKPCKNCNTAVHSLDVKASEFDALIF